MSDELRVSSGGSGRVIQWVVDDVIVDTWPMHIDPTPSDELMRRIAREFIALDRQIAAALRLCDDRPAGSVMEAWAVESWINEIRAALTPQEIHHP